ncbi:hypothetical protein NPIL_404761 [Nephila pilipes]|uniref:Uncharacterized protein n=1 Tax=Nephila pilipes TaxID=299642 RepID=A0A8X6R755_NEPPI|nr:hypothetical protein NPIL_404761 [Nephila pilipes]
MILVWHGLSTHISVAGTWVLFCPGSLLGSLRVGKVLEKTGINYHQPQDIPNSFGSLRGHPRLYWDQLINLEVPPPSISVTEGGGKPVGNRLTPPSNPPGRVRIVFQSFTTPRNEIPHAKVV